MFGTYCMRGGNRTYRRTPKLELQRFQVAAWAVLPLSHKTYLLEGSFTTLRKRNDESDTVHEVMNDCSPPFDVVCRFLILGPSRVWNSWKQGLQS